MTRNIAFVTRNIVFVLPKVDFSIMATMSKKLCFNVNYQDCTCDEVMTFYESHDRSDVFEVMIINKA